jgi:hypothetical protein
MLMTLQDIALMTWHCSVEDSAAGTAKMVAGRRRRAAVIENFIMATLKLQK